VLDVLDDREGGSDRPLRIVLVHGRYPEDADDGVTDVLLDHPAVGLDLVADPLEVRREQVVDVLGVRPFRERREPHQVAEERGDDLPRLRDGTAGVDHRPTLHAELRPVGILVLAPRATRHQRLPRE